MGQRLGSGQPLCIWSSIWSLLKHSLIPTPQGRGCAALKEWQNYGAAAE